LTGSGVGTSVWSSTLAGLTLTSPVINTPTGIVKGDVGLGNVDNTSNATERAATATLTNKTLTTPQIDTVNENTAANGVTIDGVNMKDGKLNTDNSVVTTNLTDGSVTPVKWTNPYCFSASASGATALVDNVPTKILVAAEDYDYNNNFASSTYTAPVAGVYHFDGNFTLSTIASGVLAYCALNVNGTEVKRGAITSMVSGGGNAVAADILLAAGNTVELYGYQDSAGNEDTVASSSRTYFSGHLVHKV